MILINVDTSQLESLLSLGDGLKKAADQYAEDLAGMVSAKATELAGQKLHSRREMYIRGLKPPEKVDENTWVIALDAKVRWIDDGQPQYNMIQTMLGLGAKHVKTDKDGNRYMVIPFNHSPGRGKTSTTAAQQDLISTVKTELKKRGIPFGGIEKNANGQPKLGKLHSFNVMNKPIKKANEPGQGHGAIGQVKQGNTGIPFLQNVQIYQSAGKGGGPTKRSILTFRVLSEKHRDQGKWEHPGNAPTNILDEATDWAVAAWEKEIAPAMIDKVVGDL
jgi:hypothetical protein